MIRRKNRLMIIFFLPALTAMCWWACTPRPIEKELVPPPPKLVVASQVIPNQVMVVGLTRSFSALAIDANQDTITQNFLQNILVANAYVSISYRDKVDRLYMVDSGIYVSLTTPQFINEKYTLYAYDSITGQEVSASSVLLQQVRFDTIFPKVTRGAADTVEINYTFTDPPGNNWYMINFYTKDSLGIGYDVNSYFEQGSNLLVFIDLLSDKTFPGSAYSGKRTLTNITGNDSLAVSISNISEAYYQYLALRKKSGNWFSEITKEPVNYPTNVSGGYGFFNTHYPHVAFFDLKKY